MIRYLGVIDGANLATGNIRDRESVLAFDFILTFGPRGGVHLERC